ncbi:MAG TPA: ATPase, T2SS/T4P/T4SS family, partial [Burkholderiaceae bacterium]|nr:ATPase, T2SS/T4P/T4SS family [Burkholderiaceae bacterium]
MLSLQLNYEDGSQHSQQFRLPLDIGRSAASGLRLSSWRVARRHACIQAGPQGVFIEDFGALAGTLVNGQRISYFGPLLEGTEIIIGPCRMVVEKLPLSYADISETSVGTPRGDILNATSDSTLSVNQNALTLAYGSDNNKHSLFPEGPSLHNNTARTARAELRLSTELESFEYGWNPDQQSYSEIVSSIESQVSEATATVAPSNTPALSESPPVQCVNVHLNHRRRLHRALLEALDLRRRDIVALSDEALRKEAATVLSDLINNDSLIESGVNKQVLCEEVLNEAVGLGPLEPLLADPHINEIMVNRHDEIFVEQEGRLKRHPSVFSSEQAVLSVIERIVSPLGRRIDESSPMVDARLPDGSRVNAVIPPIALRGASVTIRKFP